MIQQLVDLIKEFGAAFWPFIVIDEGEIAVRFRLGKPVGPDLGAGCHPHWPFNVDIFHVFNSKLQPVTSQAVSVTTKDNKTLTLSVNMVYCVTDARTAATTVVDIEENLGNAAEVGMCTLAAKYTQTELRTDRDEVHRELLHMVRRKARRWGVSVKEAGIRDFSPTKPYHLFVDGAVPTFG